MAMTMKAAVVREFGKPLTIEEVPIPTPRAGEVLVKIRATGVCHTDLHAADGDWPVKPIPPFIPGHEGAGVVAAVGAGVHVAIQYARAMGLHVVALDVSEEKLALARQLGAEFAVNAKLPDAIAQVVKATSGGAHGVLVTAVSPSAFSQALHLARRKGTVAIVGLPPGDFPTPIFDVVLKRITLRGSIVGTRKDLAEAIEFAADGKVLAHIHKAKLEEINRVFAQLKAGQVDGRIVLDIV